jgi:Flp pilus assembly pilin Flp
MKYLTDECGASAAEYGLLLCLMVLFLIGTMSRLGGTVNGVFSHADNVIKSP